MVARSKVKQLAEKLIRNHPELTKPRHELVSLFTFHLFKSRAVNMATSSLIMNTSSKVWSRYRLWQRFVKGICDFSCLLIPLMIKRLYLSEGSITPMIDSINREFG